MKVYKIFIYSIFLFLPISLFGQLQEILDAYKLGLDDKGIELSNIAIENGNTTSEIYYYKACFEMHKKLYKQAVFTTTESLKSLKTSDTLYGSIMLIRSYCFYHSGDLNSAIQNTNILANQFPMNLDYLYTLSYYYGEAGRFEASLRVLHKAIEIDSLNTNILNNLAFYSAEIFDYQSAIDYAMTGLKYSNDSIQIGTLLNSLGFSQASLDSTTIGLETIEKSLAFYPNNSFAYVNIGLIYLKQGNEEIACLNFKRAKELGGINLTKNLIPKYCK